MSLRTWILLVALVAVACSEDEPPPQPGSFDRPSRVAFVCFDVGAPDGPTPMGLDACKLENARRFPAGTPRDVLHALVVQSSRGEVAAVNVLDRQTIDSREDIPGYTFLPVGELPTAIVAPSVAANSDYTYVLSAGSRDVTVLRTKAFRELSPTFDPIVQTVQLPGDSRDAPLDMVLAPEEDALFVSIPTTGRLLRLPIERCALNESCNFGRIDESGITEVPLTASLTRVPPPAEGDMPMSSEPYAQVCDYAGPISNRPLPVPPLPDDIASTMPRPSGLAIDSFCEGDQPCRRRLLVADEALPLIHAVDIDAWRDQASDAAVLPPILSGAPTTTVAVTPRVPADLSAEPAETQYVYAIDARDGSVLATQDGRLLEVGTYGARPDRITLTGGPSLPLATTLTVLTPSFDVYGPAAQYARDGETAPACTDSAHPVRTNTRLRGVFLAIGVGDGSVRVVDVHDMDLAECRSCTDRLPNCTCPDGASMCDECQTEHVDPYPIVRHRTRISVSAPENTEDVSLAPTASPTFVIDGDAVQVRFNGTTSDTRLSGLACLECPDGQASAYPDEALTGGNVVDGGMADDDVCSRGTALVCALADPWADFDDWIASYRGAIPGTRGGEGRFVQGEGEVRFSAAGRFCGLGVLGDDQLDGRGDQLTLVGDLPTDDAIRDSVERSSAVENDVVAACKALVRNRDRDRDDEEPPIPIAFHIREAFDGELILSPEFAWRSDDRVPVPDELDEIENVFANDAELMNACFGNMLLSYEVRVGDNTYAVVGRDRTGFLHRVRAEDGTGRCVQDPEQDPRRTSRAREDQLFDNGFVAFQIKSGGEPQVDSSLALGLNQSAPKTAMIASVTVNESVIASVPNDLRWSGTDNTLYMVDIASRGLLQIPVDPFPVSVSRSIQ